MKKETVMMRVTQEAKRRIKIGAAENGIAMIDYLTALSLSSPLQDLTPYKKSVRNKLIPK